MIAHCVPLVKIASNVPSGSLSPNNNGKEPVHCMILVFYRLVSLFSASAANSGRGKNVTNKALSEKVTQLEKVGTDMKSQATSSCTKTKIVPT